MKNRLPILLTTALLTACASQTEVIPTTTQAPATLAPTAAFSPTSTPVPAPTATQAPQADLPDYMQNQFRSFESEPEYNLDMQRWEIGTVAFEHAGEAYPENVFGVSYWDESTEKWVLEPAEYSKEFHDAADAAYMMENGLESWDQIDLSRVESDISYIPTTSSGYSLVRLSMRGVGYRVAMVDGSDNPFVFGFGAAHETSTNSGSVVYVAGVIDDRNELAVGNMYDSELPSGSISSSTKEKGVGWDDLDSWLTGVVSISAPYRRSEDSSPLGFYKRSDMWEYIDSIMNDPEGYLRTGEKNGMYGEGFAGIHDYLISNNDFLFSLVAIVEIDE